jgi:hypothetical protein
MKRMIQCESVLEADAVLLFDWSPDVVKFVEQPCHEYPHVDDMPVRYTPDFQLVLINGSSCFIEVKPSSKLRKPSLRRRLNAIAEHFLRSSCDFRILTEIEIRNPQRIANHRELTYHARPLKQSLALWITINELAQIKDLRFGELVKRIGSRRDALRLLSHRCFEFDHEQRLCDESLIIFRRGVASNETFQI